MSDIEVIEQITKNPRRKKKPERLADSVSGSSDSDRVEIFNVRKPTNP